MNTNIRKRTSLRWSAAALAAALTGFLLSYGQVVPVPQLKISVRSAQPARSYQPEYLVASGPELAMVYIGSSTCEPSNEGALFEALDAVKLLLRDRAAAQGMRFSAIGIAKDWLIEAGVGHLEKAGPFDEIMTGRNWLNSGTVHYLWQDLPGVAATPQVIVIRRELSVQQAGNPLSRNAVGNEVLLMRKIGLEEILAWKRLGAPIPDGAPAPPAGAINGTSVGGQSER